jgi:hypothetical protein
MLMHTHTHERTHMRKHMDVHEYPHKRMHVRRRLASCVRYEGEGRLGVWPWRLSQAGCRSTDTATHTFLKHVAAHGLGGAAHHCRQVPHELIHGAGAVRGGRPRFPQQRAEQGRGQAGTVHGVGSRPRRRRRRRRTPVRPPQLLRP